jgi:hypothetical protein
MALPPCCARSSPEQPAPGLPAAAELLSSQRDHRSGRIRPVTPQELAASLAPLRTEHAGTAPAAAKRKAARAAKDQPWDWVLALADLGDPTTAEIAALLAPRHWSSRAQEVADLLRELARHDNWEVREWAAEGLAHILAVEPVLARSWLSDPDPRVRRAGVVGLSWSGVPVSERQLTWVAPLLRDPDAYVLKDVRFAVGDGLLRGSTEAVVTWLLEQAATDDPVVQQSVKVVLRSGQARRLGPALDAVRALVEN